MMNTLDINRLFDPNTGRTVFTENWLKAPGTNADLASATESVNTPPNKDFEVLGTNHTSALVTFAAGGGITITTAGASADSMIVAPHLDTKQSGWAGTNWNTLDEVAFRARIKTGASIADTTIWCGLKLTNTPVVATDANQCFFRYAAGTNNGELQLVYSNTGTDYEVDLDVALAASTTYDLCLVIDASRRIRTYINGDLLFSSSDSQVLASDIDLIPYTGVLAGAAAAKAITIRPNYQISKTQND